ncbi:MAG: dTDP-4-dehydrorhamnose 3,5-epimerase [Bacteroidia bacterium]
MKFIETAISGAWLIEPRVLSDERGFFFRTYCEHEFSEIGFRKNWVQCNYSVTNYKGAIRGLHYQVPPNAEAKLVRCVKGKIADVIVDLRANSPTFKKHALLELSGENRLSLFIPEGCAHGFQALTDDCHLAYFHSAFYSPEHEEGLRWDDPMLGISWPITAQSISERDLQFPLLTNQFKGIAI